ncbi:phospholipase D-like domain-containing protein [Actinomadura livida]|uniref:Phosphatidylserine/phosphatidylglycerophosphate/ cardiolipin synthase-like enzyme n=1 Tax=Actinomadura livida TaxID=79909 RepID=A0A7W7IHR3_9ACTN|nr:MULTISPECIES: phospholipase D-like domain-containing protein [Actinomadura]MBB4777326.1 phosphatidylserine/phosphatidylglycerophosphate/cardiolipin synthase-like enzyme [Actinomadura catellatispora]GGU20031.1 hypothetical protein GCM10010208_51200 [Actinomadura livida]
MSTRATGRLVDEDGAAWRSGLVVDVIHGSRLFGPPLGTAVPDDQGVFSLSYAADAPGLRQPLGTRQLVIRISDRVGRLVHRRERADVDTEVLDLGDIAIKRAEAGGFLVTLGTGEPSLVSDGNEVRPLIDNVEAWGHIGAAFQAAQRSIEFTQLNFFTPRFAADPRDEAAVLVFGFEPPPPTTSTPRAVTERDLRPEVTLREKGRRAGLSIRVLLDHMAIPFPFLTWAVDQVHDRLNVWRNPTDAEEARDYFRRSDATGVKVLPFLPAFYRRMHMKMAFVDVRAETGGEAISVASPFRPGYLDGPGHAIDDPARGGAADTAFPLHDVSMSMKGPAVADAYDAFRLHWNAALPAEDAQDRVEGIARPAKRAGGPESIAALQIVRTLDDGLFDERSDGERGILEGYLRAFAQAQRFIYLETQYLTNPTLADALLKAVSDRPALRVVIALNINPDIPTYPRQQQKLVNELFARLPAGRPPQVGVFTRWTFDRADPPARPRPRIAPIWLHSKVGVVDDVWATVGSANLDGASLDRVDAWAIPEFVDSRHSEQNVNILNGVDGQPATAVVETLRRRLWAEHLGIAADDPALTLRTGAEALDLWNVQAQAALQALRAPSTAPAGSAYVLPYPVGEPLSCRCCASHETPRKHLDVLGVTKDIDAVKSVRGFDYKTGDWDPRTPLQIDG